MTRAAPDACAPATLMARVRIGARVACLILWLLVCAPFAVALRPFVPRNPAPRIFFLGVLRIMGTRVKVRGNPVGARAVLLANHVSWLDIPALTAISATAFVAHSGLAENPALLWLCRLNNTIFVAREDRRSVSAQVEEVRRAIGYAGLLTIFPEGGTSSGAQVLPFKSSLLSALSPAPPETSVRPVWLNYGHDREHVAWVGEESGVASFLKIAARTSPISLTVHLLPALQGADLADRKAMATAARTAIVACMEADRCERDQRVAL